MSLTLSHAPVTDEVPLIELTCGEALRRAAARYPDTVALIATKAADGALNRWTYSELLQEAEQMGRALLSEFEPGDHVAVWAGNHAEWIFLQFGLALSGMVLVTVNPAYKPAELRYVLGQSKAKGIFHQVSYRGTDMGAAVASIKDELPDLEKIVSFADLPAFLNAGMTNKPFPGVSPHDPVMIQYTSGTTGFPKGAQLIHNGITNNSRLLATLRGARPGGADISPMPLFHTGGCSIGVMGSLQMGRTLIQPYDFDPEEILDFVESEKAEYIFAVPTMLVALLEAQSTNPRDLSSLEVIASGGATVAVELVKRVERELGANLSIVFGQTEACPVITMARLDDTAEDKSHSLGRPLPHTEVKIVDPETGETLPIGHTGELCARGYMVMQGYYDNEEATAATIDSEGWLHTGDLCSMDARGYCYVEGRLKDMIIRGGENIYPRELEELLFRHPAVAEVAVVGIPDDRWGEQVVAFIRFNDGQSVAEEELHAYMREHLSPHKTPKIWVGVERMPLTPSGKIQKFVLRDQLQKGDIAKNLPPVSKI